MKEMDEIYRNHGEEVLKFLICLTGDVVLAEELTQETFFQAIQSIHRYKGNCKMSVWLCQIGKYTYYNYLKSQKKHNRVSLEDLAEQGTEPSIWDIDQVEQRESTLNIHKLLHLLEEPYREIFMLRTFSELNFREIGEIFEKSENWARVTYYRSKLKLQEKLKENLNEKQDETL